MQVCVQAGPRAGERIVAPRDKIERNVVHEAKLLEEYIKLIPQWVARLSKKLVRIKRARRRWG